MKTERLLVTWCLRAMTLLVATLLVSSCESCGTTSRRCLADTECARGFHCASVLGVCVECVTNDDCADDSFCCAGRCSSMGSIDAKCGCRPELGSEGVDCRHQSEVSFCLVDGVAPKRDEVERARCECPCTPDQGGTLCGDDGVADAGLSCQCDPNHPTPCTTPSPGADHLLHATSNNCSRVTDTCFCEANNGKPCDPNSSLPDCTSNGCLNLNSAENCGHANHSCAGLVPGGPDGGVCLNGGCACDEVPDCAGNDLNTDWCAVGPSGKTQCVCLSYTITSGKSTVPAPCPLALPCQSKGQDATGHILEGGCVYNGRAYQTDKALLNAYRDAAGGTP